MRLGMWRKYRILVGFFPIRLIIGRTEVVDGRLEERGRPTPENRQELVAVHRRLRTAGVPEGPAGYDLAALELAAAVLDWVSDAGPANPGDPAPYLAAVGLRDELAGTAYLAAGAGTRRWPSPVPSTKPWPTSTTPHGCPETVTAERKDASTSVFHAATRRLVRSSGA
jgi:hypothetical protein